MVPELEASEQGTTTAPSWLSTVAPTSSKTSAAIALGSNVIVVPESRIAGEMKPDGVRVSEPDEDLTTREVQSTVKELTLEVPAVGSTLTEMRSPLNFLVSMPPKRTEPVLESVIC